MVVTIKLVFRFFLAYSGIAVYTLLSHREPNFFPDILGEGLAFGFCVSLQQISFHDNKYMDFKRSYVTWKLSQQQTSEQRNSTVHSRFAATRVNKFLCAMSEITFLEFLWTAMRWFLWMLEGNREQRINYSASDFFNATQHFNFKFIQHEKAIH